MRRLLGLALVAASACRHAPVPSAAPAGAAAPRPSSARPAPPRASAPRPLALKAAAPMREARALAEAIPLEDGRVLVAGGHGGWGRVVHASTELFDPRTGRWTPGAPMRRGRYTFPWTRLPDGRILVAGGRGPNKVDMSEAELYDPKTGRWSETAPLAEPRSQARMLTLPDGSALLCGGFQHGRTLASCESYAPAEGRWSPAPPMPVARQLFAFAALPDGRLLAAGGISVPGNPQGAELYDPKSRRWTSTGSLRWRRDGGAAFVPLPDGRVLVGGGELDPGAQAELYDPATGSWSDAGAISPRYGPTGALWRGRPVLIAGYGPDTLPIPLIEAREPDGTWRRLPPLASPRTYVAAAPLPGGRLLLAGGEHTSRTAGVASPLVDVLEGGAPGETAPAARPAGPRIARRPERPDDYAVVVGVERYKSLPEASFASNDAAAVAAALEALGVPEENIVRLDGSAAGLSGLSKYVEEWLPRRAKEGSRVWFYFSGHGAPDLGAGAPFLMPFDGDAAFVKSTGYPLSRLYAALQKLPAREIIVALDSCFSGVGGRSVLAPGTRPLVNVRMPESPRRLSILAAAEAGEAAGSLLDRAHGAFTWRLLEGLSGAADKDGDGGLTLAELHSYARKHVVLDARAQDREQTPTLATPTPGLRLY